MRYPVSGARVLAPLAFALVVAGPRLGAQASADLSLHDAIEVAHRNNPEILSARQEAAAASARILQSEALPDLELGISWSETPSDLNIANADERTVGIVQALEFPGKRKARGQVARHEARIAEESVRRVESLVTAEVQRAYYRAALDQKLASTMESILDLLRQFQEMATIRYQSQMVPLLEVLRAKVELARQTNQLSEARQRFQNDLADLNRVLGRPSAEPIVLTEGLSYRPVDQSLEEVLDRLLPLRASLKIANSLVDRERAATRLASKSYLPDFTVGVSKQDLKEEPPFDANRFFGTEVKNQWALDVGLSFPLLFWKRPRGQVQEARAGLLAAEIRRDAAERNVTSAIERAFRIARAAEARVQLFERSLLRDVEDELRAGIALYRNNRIDALNLIEIYRTYTELTAEYYRALYDFNVALADLEVAGEETSRP